MPQYLSFAKSDSSVIVGEAKPGETAPRRNILAKDAPWTSPGQIPEITTIYNLFTYCVKKYGKKNSMGWRTLINTHVEEKEVKKKVDGSIQTVKKKWTYFELSKYKFISFEEVSKNVHDIASGLRQIGIKPKEERFHIYAQTCREWLQIALACNSQNVAFATAYDTLGEEGLTTSMVQTETVGVFVDNSILHTLIKPVQQAHKLRIIIYREDNPDKDALEQIEKIKSVRPDIKFYSFSEVEKLGQQHPHEPTPPAPEDIACIMYTSGSSGGPKGVVLLNSNVVGGVAGVSAVVDGSIITPDDLLMAFLPLAHIFEFTFELAALYWGACLGYGNPKTLSDISTKNCKGDIKELQPTIMVAVPQVWETIRKGIIDQLSKNPWYAQKIFWGAYYAKQSCQSLGLGLPLVDSLIFRKIKEATGGRLKYIMNGGAALALPTQKFMTTLVAPLLTGYGLTETNANGALLNPKRFEYGVQGELDVSVTVKLIDVEDAGYLAKNNQGEILIKGAPVSPYYYQNEEATKEAYTEDGWFKTGDIAEWTSAGHLKIIDRKKNLVKTLHGEYVALEKLESIYRTNGYVANICVYADQYQSKPVAIIVPLERAIVGLCEKLNIEHHDEVSNDKRITKEITNSLIETGKKNGLKSVELLEGVVISKTEWTPQNGFLTSAQKLQRRKILADNKKAVEDVYK